LIERQGAKKSSLNTAIFKKAKDGLYQLGLDITRTPCEDLATSDLSEEKMTYQKDEFFRVKTEGSDLSP